jgi:preprotein translocase subunit SecG
MGFLVILQQLSAIILVVLVLMHSAKAEGIGGIGGQANVYGNAQREMEGGLDTVTIVLAVCFIVLSLIISLQKV